jgi:hypothetical protein
MDGFALAKRLEALSRKPRLVIMIACDDVEYFSRRLSERALQAQINSHFLYNALGCVNWMAFRASAADYTLKPISLQLKRNTSGNSRTK